MLKVICQGLWLCKLIYPVIYKLTSKNWDLDQTNTIMIIYKSNEMAWLLPSVLTLSRSVQLKLNADANWMQSKTEKACAKQNGIKWYTQCDKLSAIGRNGASLAQRFWTKTNYVRNTIRVNFCILKKVSLTKYPNQNTFKRNNIKNCISAASPKPMIIKPEWSDKNSSFRYYDFK